MDNNIQLKYNYLCQKFPKKYFGKRTVENKLLELSKNFYHRHFLKIRCKNWLF